MRRTLILLVMLAAGWASFPLGAQTPARPEEKPTDRTLVYKEEYIKKRFKDLTFRMLEVAKLLEASEPASARAIQEAVKQAQQCLIEHNMSKVVEYLSKGLVAMAGTTQETVIADLRKVLATLESSAADLDKLNDQIKDWQRFLEKVKQLTRDEKRHQERSRIAAEGKKLSKQMADLGRKLQNIVERQKDLLGKTRNLPSADPLARELGEARDEIRRLIKAQSGLNSQMANATLGRAMVAGHEQKQLQGRADGLSKKLGRLSKDPKVARALARPGGGANAAQAAGGLVGSAAGEMGRSAAKLDATDAAGARPHQEQAVHDLKSAEKVLTEAIRKLTEPSRAGQLAKQQSQLGKETSALAGEVKNAAAAAGPGSGAPPGQQPPQSNLDRASGHMRDAADKLDQQDKPKAADSQQKALDEMQGEARRLGELARRLLQEAEKADLKKQKRDQDVTGEQTRQLAEKMDNSSQGDQKTPGQQSVAGAQGSMQQASGKLGQGNPSGASQSQGRAVQQLRQAADDLQQAIDQARRAAQEQTLVRIDAILNQVLNVQRKITKATAETFAQRAGEEYKRPQILKLGELSDGEGDLAGKMEEVLKMVRAEGTTAVFPMVLEETRGDLSNVQKLLARKQAGPLAQSIQKEIERNLEDMIAALQREMRRRRRQQPGGALRGGDGGGRGGGGGGGPLVPAVAELKMLRSLQVHVNRRTFTLNAQALARQISEMESKLQHKIVAEREGRLVKMTKALAEKTRPGGPRPRPGAAAH